MDEAVKRLTLNPRSLLLYLGIDFQEKSGRLQMCCPFHDDRSPSAGFYLDSERFFCYACSLSLSMIQFTAKLHDVSKERAHTELETQFGEIKLADTVVRADEVKRERGRAENLLAKLTGSLRDKVIRLEQLEEILWNYGEGKTQRQTFLLQLHNWRLGDNVLGEEGQTLE